MSAVPVVPILPVRTATVPVDASPVAPSQSMWDRVSTWVSENKAVVYTVGAVAVVVTGAGVVYYLSQPNRDLNGQDGSGTATDEKRKSKKERRKAKRQGDEARNEDTTTHDVAARSSSNCC